MNKREFDKIQFVTNFHKILVKMYSEYTCFWQKRY